MKILFRLFLFALILVSVGLISKSLMLLSSVPLVYSAPPIPLCGICPAGTTEAGKSPTYGRNVSDQDCQHLEVTNPNAIYCTSDCSVPASSLPDCTGIIISQIPDATINEGSLYTYSLGSFTDQFSGPYTRTVDYGDGAVVDSQIITENNFSLSHSYQKTGVNNVTVSIMDTQGKPVTAISQVNVINVAPTVGTIIVDNATTVVNIPITAFATFTDPGTFDIHSAVWDWGDGISTVGTVTETNGSGYATNSHTYTISGVYTVTLKVVDKDGGTGIGTYQYVSVYNPTGSFLIGSGTLTSSSGDLKFGVHAKYVNNSVIPNGKIKLDLKNGTLTFNTTSYQWLVIVGNAAYVQGMGTINGTGNYSILLTAVDGTQANTPDLIRIQITNLLTNTVVYDNEYGLPIYALPTTQVTKGSIKIH